MQQTGDNDQALMLRFQASGDVAAFETLFTRHKEALLAYLMRLCGRLDVAEDVSQQAWLKLLDIGRRRDFKVSATATFRTYLFTLARNYFLDHHVRSHAVAQTRALNDDADRQLPDPNAGEAQELVHKSQLDHMLNTAMLDLPPEQREVLLLVALEEMSYADIAAALGIPIGTVMSRLSRGRERLRQIMEGQKPSANLRVVR